MVPDACPTELGSFPGVGSTPEAREEDEVGARRGSDVQAAILFASLRGTSDTVVFLFLVGALALGRVWRWRFFRPAAGALPLAES